MAFVKLVKEILALALVCVWIAQIKGSRMEADDETSATRIVYDQRQSGKYNIHVVIKDVAIIEMDQNEIAEENYNDEEYYYDEEDLTIKPTNFKPTTTTTTTIKPSTTTTTTTTTTTPNPTKTSSFTTEYNYTLAESHTGESTELNDKETTTQTGSTLWNTVIPITTSPQQLPSAVVLSTKPPTKLPAIDIKPRSKIEPIYAIEEPVLHPKYHLLDYNYGMPPQAESREDPLPIEAKAKTLTNSKIYKVKVHRSHQPHHALAMKTQTRRCRSNQYRDSRGNCRVKRSSGSILKRLFSMLVTLPMIGGGEQHNED